ncbi:MAG: hypothetical protein V9F01_08455 [Chitinophagaceae bacterium]
MKHIGLFITLLTSGLLLKAQTKQYDIFTYTPPTGFVLKEQKQRLLYEKTEGNSFCQLYVWPAQQGSNDPDANFKTDWDYFAAKPYNLANEPDKQTEKQNGWDVVTGVGPVTKDGTNFIVAVSTFTQNNISWCAITIFNEEKYVPVIDQFLLNIKADSKKFTRSKTEPVINANPAANNTGITISTTNFDDGWKATPTSDYVQVTKAGTEVRLHYINSRLDDSRPNTIDAPEFYWSHIVQPAFTVSSPQKWSGVEYPVIYFMQGNAVNKQTGKSCYVAMKVIYEGGARVVVVITPDANTYQQQFPHPNDINKMTIYNKFAVAAKDIIGTWNKAGGGGVEYYNAYTGGYTGMSAISTTDEFTFNTNNTYQSVHNSANTNSGNTQFSALKYNGKFSVSNWELMATNRVGGKTKKFWCQLEAVKGGFILVLTDSDYEPLKYILYKKK